MSKESQLHTPEKVIQVIEQRGCLCGLFYDGYCFRVVKHRDKRTGRETKAFSRHMQDAPDELLGIYGPETMFGDLADDMAWAKRGRMDAA